MARAHAALLASLPGCAALDAEALEALRGAARLHEIEAGGRLIAEARPRPTGTPWWSRAHCG